jgi:hypothetical protein
MKKTGADPYRFRPMFNKAVAEHERTNPNWLRVSVLELVHCAFAELKTAIESGKLDGLSHAWLTYSFPFVWERRPSIRVTYPIGKPGQPIKEWPEDSVQKLAEVQVDAAVKLGQLFALMSVTNGFGYALKKDKWLVHFSASFPKDLEEALPRVGQPERAEAIERLFTPYTLTGPLLKPVKKGPSWKKICRFDWEDPSEEFGGFPLLQWEYQIGDRRGSVAVAAVFRPFELNLSDKTGTYPIETHLCVGALRENKIYDAQILTWPKAERSLLWQIIDEHLSAIIEREYQQGLLIHVKRLARSIAQHPDWLDEFVKIVNVNIGLSEERLVKIPIVPGREIACEAVVQQEAWRVRTSYLVEGTIPHTTDPLRIGNATVSGDFSVFSYLDQSFSMTTSRSAAALGILWKAGKSGTAWSSQKSIMRAIGEYEDTRLWDVFGGRMRPFFRLFIEGNGKGFFRLKIPPAIH